jgi:hypothetical protein
MRIGRINVRDENLEVLKAELQAIELWDRAGEKTAPEDEINRAGFRARRMRRLEIIHEIKTLTIKSKCEFSGKQADSLGFPATPCRYSDEHQPIGHPALGIELPYKRR